MNQSVSRMAWHGTRTDIGSLCVNRAIARRGRAQHGEGLYLTSMRADAMSFALPEGFLWRCEVDIRDPGVRIVELGDGIIHYVVVSQAAIKAVEVFSISQKPHRKLNHRQRKMADADPSSWGVAIIPRS
jgi:hypothetical protein